MASGGTVEKLAARGISVAFQSVEQPAVNATGIINDDGTFHMSTFVEGGIKPGVIEGKHRVCLKAEGTTESIVPPKFRSFAASKMVVTIPSEQEIVLDVSR